MWRCDNVGGLGEHVNKHVFWFLRYSFLVFYFILRLAPSPQTWTDFDDLYVKNVPFGGLVCTAPHFGGKIPQKPQFWGRE